MRGSRIPALGLMMALHPMATTAQNMSFGADNFYRSDIVTVKPITFPTQFRTTVAGNLFIRNNFTYNNAEAPAVIVGHPMGAVKEQSANLYATKLAEQGFITISLDLPFWGGSEGEPRNGVLPDMFAEAFSAAVDYLTLQHFIDSERIGGLGICGSGSFLISAAKVDPRIKAIATSSMYDMGADFRTGVQGLVSPEQLIENIAEAAQQRTIEARGGAIRYGGGTPLELTEDAHPIIREFFDYYRTPRAQFTPPGALPNFTTHRTLATRVKFFNFYPFNDIDAISPRPLLFISGELAHSREFSEKAYALAAKPKELFWVPRAGHVDLYDRVDLIPFDKLTQFFQKNLGGN